MTAEPNGLTTEQLAIAEAVGIAEAALSAAELAAVTGLPVGTVLAAGDTLISQGWLTDDNRGYGPTARATALELSHARRTQMSRQIAETVIGDRPGLAGHLLLAAGDQQSAFDAFSSAALSGEPTAVDAHELAESALSAADGVDVPVEQLGRLHMVVGNHHKTLGDSTSAHEAFAAAAFRLEGVERIDALGLCAATADDQQRPQTAERWLAAAQYEAVRQGEMGNYGSLLALHARTLSRIGFPSESDRALAKGRILLADATARQHHIAATHEAWIMLDRGFARNAEAAFASLAFEAERNGDSTDAAFHTVYHARALFAAGQAHDAELLLETIQHATGALLFLKHLALTEGAGWFEQWDIAAQRARETLDVIASEVPQWENVGRFHLARALLGIGDLPGARRELIAAYATCPPGTDGWRWRMRCKELDLGLTHAEGSPWDKTTAENLTDELLVARWFDTACDLMIERAAIEKDRELARQAAGLAESIGNPTLAIRAAHVGDLWSESKVGGIARSARAIHAGLDEGSRERWAALDHVAAALAAEPTESDVEELSLIDELNETMSAIGLAGSDALLTPAQRHQHGLVRRGPTVHKAGRWLGIAAGIAAVIGISVVTALALQPDPVAAPGQTVIVTETVPATTIQLTVEQTKLDPPADKLTGAAIFGGDYARTGRTDATGVPVVGGVYWTYPAGDSIRSTPVAFGNWVYFGSQDFDIYAINQTTGVVHWTLKTGGAVLSTAAVGQVALSEGAIGQGSITLLAIGSDDGNVWARNAVEGGNLPAFWKYDTGQPVRTTPLFSDNLVIVAGGDGRVHGIRGADGQAAWIYPDLLADPLAAFETSPSLSNGIVYVGDSDGVLHLIDAATGLGICEFPSGSRITTPVSIIEGVTYFGNASSVFQMPEGTCASGMTNAGVIPTEANFDVTVYHNELLMPDGVVVYAFGLPAGESLGRSYKAEADISSPSIISNDILYFGDNAGFLHAVDAATLGELWKFKTENRILAAPAIGDGVVFVASGSVLYAIGPKAP